MSRAVGRVMAQPPVCGTEVIGSPGGGFVSPYGRARRRLADHHRQHQSGLDPHVAEVLRVAPGDAPQLTGPQQDVLAQPHRLLHLGAAGLVGHIGDHAAAHGHEDTAVGLRDVRGGEVQALEGVHGVLAHGLRQHLPVLVPVELVQHDAVVLQQVAQLVDHQLELLLHRRVVGVLEIGHRVLDQRLGAQGALQQHLGPRGVVDGLQVQHHPLLRGVRDDVYLDPRAPRQGEDDGGVRGQIPGGEDGAQGVQRLRREGRRALREQVGVQQVRGWQPEVLHAVVADGHDGAGLRARAGRGVQHAHQHHDAEALHLPGPHHALRVRLESVGCRGQAMADGGLGARVLHQQAARLIPVLVSPRRGILAVFAGLTRRRAELLAEHGVHVRLPIARPHLRTRRHGTHAASLSHYCLLLHRWPISGPFFRPRSFRQLLQDERARPPLPAEVDGTVELRPTMQTSVTSLLSVTSRSAAQP
mmetsp:Transcript_12251/g.29601  ORF Transcript_12251/g.29601 Transcript_12251/m.29601 type:complete len:472 (-) Transcript_12251:14-1429(-)